MEHGKVIFNIKRFMMPIHRSLLSVKKVADQQLLHNNCRKWATKMSIILKGALQPGKRPGCL